MHYHQILKEGRMAARIGWKDKFIFYVDILNFGAPDAVMAKVSETIDLQAKNNWWAIAMKTADNRIMFGWTPTMEDATAEDWVYIQPNPPQEIRPKAEIPI
jgi:hypothetical protein